MIRIFIQHKFFLFAYLLFVPLSCLSSVRFALSFQPVIDATLQRSSFFSAAFSCAFWGIADLLLLLLVRRLRFALLARTKASFKQQLCSSILSAPYQMFENKDCLSLLNNDTQTICDCFFAALLSIYQVIWSFILSLASVSLLNPAITTTLLGIGLVSVLAPHWLGRRLDQMQTACSTLKEEYSLLVQDLTGGLITLKTCRAEKAFAARHQRINQKLEAQQCAVNNRLYLSTWISMLCSTAAYLLTLLVGGWFVLQGRMTTGAVISISQLIGGVVAPLEQVPELLSQIRSTQSLRLKCEEILKTAPDHRSHCSDGENLTCSGVRFHYPNSSNGIQSFDFCFLPPRKYWIAGGSGSGKSTIAKLIAGLYRCEGGEIRYPHTAEDRPQVMYIPQKAHIFRDTLRNNLTMGSSFSDSQLLRVLEQCGLSDFLASLPNGLSSFLDGAACCSGGEAQRISLARAILQRPSILIADEITANLDHQNAQRIESLLLSLQDTMLISIGHRLLPEVLSRYDCILTMAEGSIVESGPFSPLEK